ncbi:MAG: DUF2029 domain-containing protein [Acidimicrobiales bacterium]|nr:DUF2029 domain-containing protein [Acidimicrobiales bacterium]
MVGAAALVGLVLRLAWVRYATREPQGLFDPARYVGYARVIADGQGMIEPWSGHPTAYYPPGYPWFLGILTWFTQPFTDQVWTVAAVTQSILGAATVVLAALVARRLAGPSAGAVAAVVLAVYPNLIFHSGAVLGETLYNALFMAFLVACLGRRWPDDITNRRALLAGLLLGLAVMVRPISLAVLPVAVGVWWWSHRDRRRALVQGALLVAGVVACMAPWTVRNALRMDDLVWMSTNTGDNLCIGHGPGATGAFSARDECATEHNFLDGPAAEIAADREKTRIALDAIREDPGREPWLTWRRFWYMWLRDGDHDGILAVQSYRTDRFIPEATEARLSYTADVVYWAVASTGAVGLVFLLRRRRPEDLLLVGSAVMTAAVPLAFFGDSRFKVPVIPLLIVASACLAAEVARQVRAVDRTDAGPGDPAGHDLSDAQRPTR